MPVRPLAARVCAVVTLLGSAGAGSAGCGDGKVGDGAVPGARTLAARVSGFGPHSWPSYGRDFANTRTARGEPLDEERVAGMKLAWEVAGVAVTSTPVVVDGVVYFGGWDGRLYARRLRTGAVVWTQALSARPISASALATDDALFIGDGDGVLHKVDRKTGEPIWAVELDAHVFTNIFGSPLYLADENMIVIGVAGTELAVELPDYTFRGCVVALDADTGEQRWRLFTTQNDETSGAGVSVWGSPAVDRERKTLYVGTGNSYEKPAAPLSDSLLAIRYDTGELRWHQQFTADDVFTIPGGQGPDADVGASPNLFTIDARDVVGVGDKAGIYRALDRDTGEILWARLLTVGSRLGGVMASTAYDDGVIYVNSNFWGKSYNWSEPGNVSKTMAIAAEDGEILWSTDLAAPCFGGMAVAGDVLFHGTLDGVFHAFATDSGAELWRDRLPHAIGGGSSLVDGHVLTGHGFVFFTGGVNLGGLRVYKLPDRDAGDEDGEDD